MSSNPQIKSRKYKDIEFYPLLISDFAEWDKWAREDFLDGCNTKEDDPEQRHAFYLAAVEAAGRISFGSPKSWSAMTSVTGKIQTCYLSMRRGDTRLTRNKVWSAIVGDPATPEGYQNLTACFVEVLKVSGIIPEVDDPNPTNPVLLAMKVLT